MNTHEYEPPQNQSAALVVGDEVMLPTHQVLAWVRGISAMTLWRWLRSDHVQFPQPTLVVNNRRYWSAGAIRRWLAKRAAQEAAA